MLEHLDEELTVDLLARKALMSPRTFARRFRAETGTTPNAWLNRQRLLRAQQLLEETDLTLEEIARETGFGAAAVMRHHFVKVLQTTPTAYRRAVRAAPGRLRPAGRDRGQAGARPVVAIQAMPGPVTASSRSVGRDVHRLPRASRTAADRARERARRRPRRARSPVRRARRAAASAARLDAVQHEVGHAGPERLHARRGRSGTSRRRRRSA